MEVLMSLLLLIISAWSQGEPLTEAVLRRRDSFGVYASEFAHDYETFAFAAIPLHSPLPILHILSPTPLRLPLYKHPRHPTIKPADSTHQHIYAPSMNHLLYATPFPEREEIQTPETILYARPNSNGGYTYRRRPVNKRNASKNNTLKEPVIIRVHKYRIVRD